MLLLGLGVAALALLVLLARRDGGSWTSGPDRPAGSAERGGEAPAPRAGGAAVIVDQLALTVPNQGFVDRATAVLEGAGYQVDVVSGKAVDVEAYRSLPERGYGLIVLRVHSARVEGPTGLTDDVALFTGEMIDLAAYNLSEVSSGAATAVAGELERLAASGTPRTARARFSDAELAALIPVTYSSRGVELPWFGLRPEFVRDHLRGRFPAGTTVILMGCDGLRSTTLGSAFLDRGAASFVSWDRPVSAGHTDEAALRLIELVVGGGRTPSEAVEQTMSELGPDPDSGAVLRALP